MITVSQGEKDMIWSILGRYKDVKIKLDWYIFHPSVKVGAILLALLGPEPT